MNIVGNIFLSAFMADWPAENSISANAVDNLIYYQYLYHLILLLHLFWIFTTLSKAYHKLFRVNSFIKIHSAHFSGTEFIKQYFLPGRTH